MKVIIETQEACTRDSIDFAGLLQAVYRIASADSVQIPKLINSINELYRQVRMQPTIGKKV